MLYYSMKRSASSSTTKCKCIKVVNLGGRGREVKTSSLPLYLSLLGLLWSL